MKLHLRLAKRFGYTRYLEKEIDSLRADRVRLLDYIHQQDVAHFVGRTGFDLPEEFEWDSEGWVKYQKALDDKKEFGWRPNVDRIPLRAEEFS